MPIPAFSIHLTRNNLSRLEEIYDNKSFIEDKICIPVPKRQARIFENIILENNKLPIKLSHINTSIENAKYILSLEEDWDGDGAMEIPIQIFNRAVNFLKDYSTSLLTNSNIILVAPTISPVKDGSIDLLWETKRNSLLVNIKNSDKNDAFYYGVLDIKNQKFDYNGNIKTDSILSVFSDWLKEYQVVN